MNALQSVTAWFTGWIRVFLLGTTFTLITTAVFVQDTTAAIVPPSDGGAVGQLPPSYEIVATTGVYIPGVVDAGNHCDDCTTELVLPFPVSFYGQTFTRARISSNGALQFGSDNSFFFNECLPYPEFEYSIIPHWDDLDAGMTPGDGVYTTMLGTAPNRVFVIEWRTHPFADFSSSANFEVLFREGSHMFEIIYGDVGLGGSSATVGVQGVGDQYTQYSCDQSVLFPGLRLLVGYKPAFADNDSATVSVNSGDVAINAIANDSDYTGTLRISEVTAASHGYVSFAADGLSVLYRPVAEFIGTDSFTYTITNILGGSATATVNIEVINHDPNARDDSAVVDEDSSVTVAVLGNDDTAPDAGETLSVISAAGAVHGTLVYTPSSVSYTPQANYFGLDSFTYTIADNHGGNATAQVTITVQPVNDNPTAVNDTATVDQGNGALIQVLANDTIAPDTGEALTISAVGSASHGSVHIDGTAILYTPATGFHGSDAFAYTISDGNGGAATAQVNVTVRQVNSAPELSIQGSAVTLNENDEFTLHGVVSDLDLNDTHTVLISWGDGTPNTVLQLNGAASFSAAHRFLDNPPAGSGFAPISVTVTDLAGASATRSLAVTIQNVTPVIDSIVTSSTIVQRDVAVFLTVAFSDPGTLDSHQVRINWGDGSEETLLSSGGYSQVASHAYVALGIFSPVVSVTDKDGGTVSASAQEIVVYDPFGGAASGAAITGGGWIELPPGVAARRPSLSGKASFSVDVKYSDDGRAVGTLSFALGGFTLSSTDLDWMIVSANRATLQGQAKVNGSGAFRFRFSGVDGGPVAAPDQLRLQVWSVATSAIVFDTAGIQNVNDNSLLQALGGGNISVRPAPKKSSPIPGPSTGATAPVKGGKKKK